MDPREGMLMEANFEYRLSHPFSALVSGPSSCGKTTLIKDMITRSDRLIAGVIDRVVYVYSCWQPAYTEMLKSRPTIQFLQSIPESLEDETLFPSSLNNLLIIDDKMDEAANNLEVEKAFTKYSHHRNLSVVYIVQNLFFKGKSMRTISLNANYLILFKSPRDVNQIGVIARQMFPKKTGYFMESYEDACKKTFGYLLIDFKPRTPDVYRLRAEIQGENPVVYVPRKRQ